jgi:hypothetical protein
MPILRCGQETETPTKTASSAVRSNQHVNQRPDRQCLWLRRVAVGRALRRTARWHRGDKNPIPTLSHVHARVAASKAESPSRI